MEIEEEIKNLNQNDDFKNILTDKEKKSYEFITKAYFLKKDKLDILKNRIKYDYENKIINLLENELDLINKYNDLFVDELRNYSIGKIYNKLKELIQGNEDEKRKILVKYINLMNEYELTYEEELDFGNNIIDCYKDNKITFQEPLEKLMDYLEENYME